MLCPNMPLLEVLMLCPNMPLLEVLMLCPNMPLLEVLPNCDILERGISSSLLLEVSRSNPVLF
jgi:hypothetical protein